MAKSIRQQSGLAAFDRQNGLSCRSLNEDLSDSHNVSYFCQSTEL
jgi:hypothetical protein